MHVINENGLHHKTSFGGIDIRLSKMKKMAVMLLLFMRYIIMMKI